MGRIAGVTAAETRQRLLASAAKVFARDGYADARVSEIARDAGLTTGAIYAHYATKTDLLCEAIRSHGSHALAVLAEGELPDGPVSPLLRLAGRALVQRPEHHGALLIAAVVAARRDPDVAKLLRGNVCGEEETIAEMLSVAQEHEELGAGVPIKAVARLCMMLALGSVLANALELPEPKADEWSSVIDRLVETLHGT